MTQRRLPRRLRPVFTLIELLVVVAIIAILAAMLLPVLGRARESAKRTGCLNNAQQINLAMAMYGDDHEEYLLPHATLFANMMWDGYVLGPDPTATLIQYVRTSRILYCPSSTNRPPDDTHLWGWNGGFGLWTDYTWLPGLSVGWWYPSYRYCQTDGTDYPIPQRVGDRNSGPDALYFACYANSWAGGAMSSGSATEPGDCYHKAGTVTAGTNALYADGHGAWQQRPLTCELRRLGCGWELDWFW